MSAAFGIDGMTPQERKQYGQYALRARKAGRTPVAKDHWLQLRHDPERHPNANIRFNTDDETRLRVEQPPSGELNARQIIERQKEDFLRKAERESALSCLSAKIPEKGPIGILFFGDPHLDDGGTDWFALERDMKLVKETEGLYGANIGDTTNNWIGRLERLHAVQSVTAGQAWELAKHFIGELAGRWLFHIGGNHDCHDDQTECYVQGKGWVLNHEIEDGDFVLTHRQDGSLGWECPTAIIRRHHAGKMVSFEARGINFCVTPNHRIYHKSRKNRVWDKDWSFTEATTMPGRIGFAVSGRGELAEADGDSEDRLWLQLAGWLLTDGCISGGRVSFYQSKQGCPLSYILDKLGLRYTYTTRHRDIESVCGRPLVKPCLPQGVWMLSAEASRKVLQFVPDKGFPDWGFNLSDYDFQIFLDAIVAGDGTWDGKNPDQKLCAVIHGKPDFLGDLQTACIMHGWYARISMVRGKDYRLNICKRDMIQHETSRWVKEVDYDGEVWCLTVPSGNFLVRRNGAAHFSGNCWSADRDPLGYICSGAGALYLPCEARLRLDFPVGEPLTVNARHDFPGHSMWNTAHAPNKAFTMGYRDEIMICGHKHKSGYNILKAPEGTVGHAIQIASYKRYDRYQKEKGFKDQTLSPSCLTVIDPEAADPVDRVQVFWNPERGAAYLKWLRGQV